MTSPPSQSRAVQVKADHDVAYVTDVEGSWTRLASFLDGNRLVTLDDAGRIVVKPGATFVFGGDAIDRGPWSRKIVRTLLEAKLRQPDQVVLLGGNRDLNKLRLAREITGHPPRRAPDDVQRGPRAQLLKWIFAHTMGAADAFEHRRTELRAEGRAHDEISDEGVAQSYVDDLANGGELARYLEQCQLAWRSGRTLFVHGGLAEEALTVVPGTPDVPLAHFDVDEWIARLNAFYAHQMDAFRARAIESDGRPAWESAILYQAPKKGMKLNPGSVVYGRMADEHNNPLLPKKDVVDALVRAGVNRVVVGHTPSGDTPSIVRTKAAPFEIVNADNSRSRVDSGSRVFVRDDVVELAGNVVLDDGARHPVALELARDDRKTPIGLRVDGGGLVKAPIERGWLVFRYLPAYEVTQTVLDDASLGALSEPDEALDEPPPNPTTSKP